MTTEVTTKETTEKNPLHSRHLFSSFENAYALAAGAFLSDVRLLSNIPAFSTVDQVTDDGSGSGIIAHLEAGAAQLNPGFVPLYIPMFKRSATPGEKKQFQLGVMVQVPGIDVFASDPQAAAYMYDAVIERMVRVIKSSAAEIVSGEEGAQLPCALADYMESGGRDRGLTEFNEIAGETVKQLRDSGFSGMTKEQLKMLLQSRSFSAATYGEKFEKIKFWERLLDKLIADIKSQGGTGALLETWKRTRDQKAATLEREIDFAALGISVDADDEA